MSLNYSSSSGPNSPLSRNYVSNKYIEDFGSCGRTKRCSNSRSSSSTTPMESVVTIPDISSLHLQSGDEQNEKDPGDGGVRFVNNASRDVSTGLLKYKDENAGVLIDYNPISDVTMYDDFTVGTDMDNFFSRPVLIQSYTWVQGTPFSAAAFRPWYLYFNDARIEKKLDNYAFISCNLHVKIMINASPFLYGLMLASYRPQADAQPTTVFQVSPGGNNYLINISQRPHVWIYPATSQGGELILPYFNYKNWISATSAADMQNMGEVKLYEYVPLANANSIASTNISIQIYAWATDVRLSGSTLELSLQAGDEYSSPNGVISKPASAVSKAASMLAEIPVLSRFAMATSVVASAVAGVAQYFGFTNAPVITAVQPMKPFSFHTFASPEISQPVDRLVWDPKNELTVDPRIVGLPPRDELCLGFVLGRESYLTQVTWDQINVTDTVLFSSWVLPELFGSDANPPNILKQCTPLSYFQEMFQYWRGDIIFRFRFICTRFHRGRVRIIWDPIGDTVDTDPLSSNVAYNRIVDISEETDIELTVPYVQDIAFLNTFRNNTTVQWNSGTVAGTHGIRDNGKLVLRVFTELSSPALDAPIQIVISVRAGENFEFCAPRDLNNSFSTFQIQSGDEPADEVANQLENKELMFDEPTRDLIAYKVSSHNVDLFKVHMGEVIRSFRTLLRRVSHGYTISSTSVSVTDEFHILTGTHNMYPLVYGYDLNGIHSGLSGVTPPSNVPFNFVNHTAFNWITACYVAMRGSMMWHYNTRSPVIITNLTACRRFVGLSAAGYSTDTGVPTGSTVSVVNNFNLNNMPRGPGGMSLTNASTQAGISVDVPFYSNYRFKTTYNAYRTLDNNPRIDTNNQNVYVSATVFPATTGSTTLSANKIDAYYSAGTDFTCFYFLNVPTLHVYNSPTPN